MKIQIFVVACFLAGYALVDCSLNPQPFPPRGDIAANTGAGGSGNGSSGGGSSGPFGSSSGAAIFADGGRVGEPAADATVADAGIMADTDGAGVEGGNAQDAPSDALNPADAPNETEPPADAATDQGDGSAPWDVAIETRD